MVATGWKFDGGGLNVIAPASRVRVAYLSEAPAAGTPMLAEAGVEVVRV
jgi:hypothetical protein